MKVSSLLFSFMIGVFDSGLGGLTYVQELRNIFPNVDIISVSDTKNVPYGGKSDTEILSLVEKNMDFFEKKSCPLVIIACNTASGKALHEVQIQYDGRMKILGVLIPACEEAVEKTQNKKIGLLATEFTVATKSYEREIGKLDVNVQVFSIAAPELVLLIESGEKEGEKIEKILRLYWEKLSSCGIDTLILGCTHYSLLLPTFKKIVPENIHIVNSSHIAAGKLHTYLNQHSEIKEKITFNGKIEIECTGDKKQFKENIQKMFPNLI